MIWKIAKKEFLLNLMTFKFAVGTILCVVLTAVFVPILAKAYQERLETYNENITYNKSELNKVTIYKNITPTIYRQPSALSVFSEGLEKQLGNSATINYNEVPEITGTAANHYLSIFSIFDASLIFKIVLSVLALLVAYDAISGERERGTLKLMLSGTSARYQVLLGKLLAGLMVLVGLVTITFILGLVILLSFPMVGLAGADWVRIVFMFIASLVFIAMMYNLGLLFSCLARRSAISLVLGLFMWIIFVAVIPNGSVYLATQILPVESEDKVNEQIALLRRDAQREFVAEFRNSGRSFQSGTSQNDKPGKGGFGHGYVRSCNKAYMENNLIRYGIGVPIEIKYADKYSEVEYSRLRSLFEQTRLADNLSRISPVSLYEKVMSAMAGTDMDSFRYFINGVKAHRNDVIEYIRSRTNNFSSSSFFTPCTVEEMELMPSDDAPPLDLRDLPRYVYKADIIGSLRRVIPDLAFLVFGNVLFFALAFVAFARYDVR
jgi:ABC-type transport system involved in multi-copper enzyme maturation permease subunit